MGVKRKPERKPKHGKPLATAIKLTAATLLIMLAVWFIAAPGEFSLFGLFDRYFMVRDGDDGEGFAGAENVIVWSGNSAAELGIDSEAEEVILAHFRHYYKDSEDINAEIFVTLYYGNAAFAGSFAVIELRESIVREFSTLNISSEREHTFSLRRRQNKWVIEAHEYIVL
jgi:hypothetical protein